jgi:hypothetical protein
MADYHQPPPALSLRHGDTCAIPGCPSVRSQLQPNGWWCAGGKRATDILQCHAGPVCPNCKLNFVLIPEEENSELVEDVVDDEVDEDDEDDEDYEPSDSDNDDSD